MDFVVPVHTEDLELPRQDRFCVHEVTDVENVDASRVADIVDGEWLALRRAVGPTSTV